MPAATALIWLMVCVPATAWAQEHESRGHFNRGVELQRKGDLAGARLAYEEALKLSPKRVDALSNLGLVYVDLGAHDRAIERLSQALAIRSDLHMVRLALALAHFRTGQFRAAEREVASVVAAAPGNPRALHLLGLSLLKLDRIADGVTALEASLQADPKNSGAAQTLATAYVRLGEVAKAEALLDGPLASGDDAEIYLVRGTILNAKGEYGAAVEELSKAKERDNGLPTVDTQLGYALMFLSEPEKARNAFLAALAKNSDDFEANGYLGWLYLREKRHEEAFGRLQRALREHPDSSALLYMIAQVYRADGENEKAADVLERVVKQRPDFLPAQVLLATTYSRLKRSEDYARQQAVISRLTKDEQDRNLGSQPGEVDTDLTLPTLSEDLSGKPRTGGGAQR
ncbi:MAG: tetratricopeptide repeat protein [Acidobacteriota bacterium]|nr:tetratricopeptide repeat protein [Acidobacteriota bacterium]